MSELRGRALMEQRFGKLGTGKATVMIGDAEYDLETALARLDLAMEDTWPMDILETAEGNFCVRYYDGQDQRVVAHEFDAESADLDLSIQAALEYLAAQKFI